jgi:dihydroneopterin aldolase
VLFADQAFKLEHIQNLANSGFKGVMLDTANKSSGSLCSLLSTDMLSTFIAEAGRNHLVSGLAGSLRFDDIDTLTAHKPDYLGFRGALCKHNQRTDQLSSNNIRAIRKQLTASNQTRAAHVI